MTITVLNAKIKEFENKMSVVSGVVTTTVLNTKIKVIKNKIPVFSGLVKKTDYDTKIKSQDSREHISLLFDYSKFTSDILDEKIKEKE